MTRKDGRPLVTEHPVTAMDMIDAIPADEIPPGLTACTRSGRAADGWIECGSDEPDEDFDIGEWYA